MSGSSSFDAFRSSHIRSAVTPSRTRHIHSPYHHDSHRLLLDSATVRGRLTAQVDAIIVPTARRVTYLHEAARLAQKLGCPLIALCSGAARAADAAQALKTEAGLQLVVMELSDGFQHSWLSFATSRTPGALLARRSDTSLKRNLGLLLARLVNWHRIVFLDDDISVEDPLDLSRAAALLDSHDVVGLSVEEFPDNSVVCHAYGLVGGRQDTFVGGGALAVAPMREWSFFPDIYNDDWFFLLDNVRLRSVTITGKAEQRRYDPFAGSERARSEEFGDVLAEGIFHLLDLGYSVEDADETYWRSFLRQRSLFIHDIMARVPGTPGIDPLRQECIIRALNAALGRHKKLSGRLCVSYLRGWLFDRTQWQQTLGKLPTGLSLDDALRRLGFRAQSQADERVSSLLVPCFARSVSHSFL